MSFKIQKKQKAVSPLISGVLIILISVAVAGIIIIFSNAYFGTLGDIQKYKNNKQNLEVINNILNNMKTQDIGSYKLIKISPTDIIHFDSTKNNITITQKIKNINFLKNQKDSITYGNINIKKSQDNLIFTLSLNDIDLNNNYDALKNNQIIDFNIVGINNNNNNNNNNKNIRITRVNENQSLFANIEYTQSTYTLGETVNLSANVYNSTGDYNCTWDSNIDGLLCNDCNFSTTSLSSGTHNITLSVTDENQTFEKIINVNIINPTSITIDNPLNLSSYNFEESINFNSTISNPVGSYTCSWDSNIDNTISNECDFSTTSLSSGTHNITLSVTDENQTIDTEIIININPTYLDATGGIITFSGDYKIHTFTSDGTFDVTTLGDGLIDVLVVAGGGGGGSTGGSSAGGGGGGAGGLIFIENYNVSLGSINITVGAGGIGGAAGGDNSGSNGENSSFDSLIAIGGGGGGARSHDGSIGGSGGGGGSRGGSAGAGTVNQGNNGGDGDAVAGGNNAGGGGGGASSCGNIGIINNTGGNGGNGLYFGDKFTDTFGDNGYFSGGGGGGISRTYQGGIGGLGGGGNGGSNSTNGDDAINNTGGGGGGASHKGNSGGHGGSGIVIIRYKYNN